MQNKPNLPDAQMNLTSLITVDYENKPNWKLDENKPNQSQYKPNQSQYKAKQSQKNAALHLFAVGYLRKKLYSVTV